MAKRGRRLREQLGGAEAIAAGADAPALAGIALLLSEHPVEKLDLHGLKADQAERRVIMFMKRQSLAAGGRVVHIITGKGTRSDGAPVLPGLVRDLLDDELSGFVAESAGLPGGGGVAVRLKTGSKGGGR